MINKFISLSTPRKLWLGLVALLVAAIGYVNVVNMDVYPIRFEDEGTYVAQAWAVQYMGELAHYTYWYDHPPIGWVQLAAWTTATDGFDRAGGSPIIAGREFMAVARIISLFLLYILARRLGFNRAWSAAAVVLYGLSPLAVEYGRYVLLDNIAMPWLLLAFVLALSPRKSIASVIGSAICMAIAILSKETFFLLLPVLIYALWLNSDKRNRRFSLLAFGTTISMLGGFYILYALLKGEFFEGEGHVSLIGAIKWQLLQRSDSGSIFNPGSEAYGLIIKWLEIDPWLLVGGIILLPLALFVKNLRIVGLALFIQIIMMMRPGYLPYPFVISLLPFAALMIAGAGNALTKGIDHSAQESIKLQVRAAAAVIAIVATLQFAAPFWSSQLAVQMTEDQDKPARDAIVWINKNIDKDQRLVVDSGLWLDLRMSGYVKPEAAWLYKTETDPEVANSIGGWRGIDYVAVPASTLDASYQDELPTLFEAKARSAEVASFGEDKKKIVILKVNPDSEPAVGVR